MAAAKRLPTADTMMLMKKTLITVAVATLFAFGTKAADSTVLVTNPPPPTMSGDAHRFGVGIILGEPTGASLKYWLNDTLAIDGAIGASFNDDDDNDSEFYLHSDVLWHNFDLLKVPKGQLPVYFGVGALVRFRDDEDNQVGVRIPVGLSYMFDNVPIDIFAEIAPAIDMAPDVRGEITGGIGIRFWF
jgi:hypothetical protein